jgi:hypothetical protein
MLARGGHAANAQAEPCALKQHYRSSWETPEPRSLLKYYASCSGVVVLSSHLGTLLLLNLFRVQMKSANAKTESSNGTAKQW